VLLQVVDLGIDARKPLTTKQVGEVAHWRTRVEDLLPSRLVPRPAGQTRHQSDQSSRQFGAVLPSSGTARQWFCWTRPKRASHCRRRVRGLVATPARCVPKRRPPPDGSRPDPSIIGPPCHRLNRGGDRRLNRALHMAVVMELTRLRGHSDLER